MKHIDLEEDFEKRANTRMEPQLQNVGNESEGSGRGSGSKGYGLLEESWDQLPENQGTCTEAKLSPCRFPMRMWITSITAGAGQHPGAPLHAGLNTLPAAAGTHHDHRRLDEAELGRLPAQ